MSSSFPCLMNSQCRLNDSYNAYLLFHGRPRSLPVTGTQDTANDQTLVAQSLEPHSF